MSKELNTFNLEEDETSSSQTKKHKWTRADGKILTSTFLLPPWDNLKEEEKNDDGSIESTILLSPTLQDNKNITVTNLTAQANWGNYYLQKGIQHLQRNFDKQNSDFKKSEEERKTVMDEQGSRWSIVLSKINEFGLGMNALSKSVSESIPINDHYQSMIDTISLDSKNTRRYLRTITEKLSVLNKRIEQQPETTQPPHLSSYPTYQPTYPQNKNDKGFILQSPEPFSYLPPPQNISMPSSSPSYSFPGLSNEIPNPMYIPASFNIKDKKKKKKILSSDSEEEPEKIESLHTIHDIPGYFEVDPATFELLAKMDSEYYESPSSKSETDELDCNISSCSECDECHTSESSSDDKLHFQIPKWKNKKEWRSLLEFYSSRESKPPREFKGDTIYTWSIDSKTTQEIIDMCGDMLTCYRCYLASGLDSILAYKMITSGFTGSLQQWMYAVEKQTPGTLSTWEQMILLHTSGPQTGQPILDEQGKAMSNALGCMVHYLQNAFIGNEKPEPGVLELWLQKMK